MNLKINNLFIKNIICFLYFSLFIFSDSNSAIQYFRTPGGALYNSAIAACTAEPPEPSGNMTFPFYKVDPGGGCHYSQREGDFFLLDAQWRPLYTIDTDCPAGFTDVNNSCVPSDDPCELLADMCTGAKGSAEPFQIDGKKTGVSFVCRRPTLQIPWGADALPGCERGCMAQTGSFATAFQNDSGSWVTQGTAKGTGSTCDPNVIDDLNAESNPEYERDEEPKRSEQPDPSCPNGQPGSVNGVTVCVPYKASSGVTEMETKDNGDGTKTDTKTEVKCENGKCEVTKTSTTTNTSTGGTVSNSSVTTTLDKADYCSKNKNAGACKDEQGENGDGNGKFGGSCQGGFTCEGDAVMCAMAKEQHKRACETLEPAKDGIWKQISEGTDTGSADAMKSEAATINISTDLNMGGYGLPRSCPADPVIELPFVSKSFTIPFSKACPILKTMSDVALLITALSLLVWLVAPRGKAE